MLKNNLVLITPQLEIKLYGTRLTLAETKLE